MKPNTLGALAPLSLSLLLCGSLSAPLLADDLEEMVESCEACHGSGGVSSHPDVPTIAGFSEDYTLDSMLAYQDEERPCPQTEYRSGKKKGKQTTMCKVAEDLSEDEIQQLAEYFAAKEFVRAEQDFDAALAKKGEALHEAHCAKCHNEGGSLPSDDAGILAGQWMPYLKQTFSEFSSGARPMNEKMKSKYEKLEQSDIEALLHYYASFK